MVEEGEEGEEILTEQVVFFILNLAFFIIMFIFVARTGSGASIYEEIYAKKIALLVDEAKPGTSMNIDISKILETAEKNNFEKEIIKIENNNVIIKLAEGGGFSFNYFSYYKVYSSVNWQTRRLDIEVKNE